MVEEYLSTRSKKIFKRHFEGDKSKLVNYYREKGQFLDIKSCGKKSNKELIKLSQATIDDKEESITREVDSNLDVLKGMPDLSNRALNIYDKYFDQSEDKLLSYYRENSDFLQIKNSGKKTNQELIEYVNSIINRREFLGEEVGKSYSDLIKNLGHQEREFLECYLKYLKDKNKLSQSITIDQLLTRDLTNFEERNKLNSIKFNILHYLESIQEGDLIAQYALELIIKNFDSSLEPTDYLENSNIYILKLFKDINEEVLNETEAYIFENFLNYSLDEPKHERLDTTGEALDLTRERVRQIAKGLQENFEKKFSPFRLLNPLIEIEEYNSSQDSHLIVLNKQRIRSLNKRQQTNYNHLLINKLLALISRDDYSFLGSEKNYHSLQRIHKCLDFSWSYLVSKQIKKEVKLIDFLLHIENLLEQDHDENQEFSLKFLLFDFSNVDSLLKLKEYYESISTILRREFDLVISGDSKFTIRRNTKRKNYEYPLEVLEEMEPQKEGYGIEVISKKIYKRFGIDFSDNYQSLRSAINNSEEFIFFGRNSQYGLKKWEKEIDEIKGGTIRSIVEEFLLKFDEPKHIGVIANEVNKYRDTSADYIYSNLKLDPHGNYTFYNGGYIGLGKKDYNGFEIKKVNPRIFADDILGKFLPTPYDKFIEEFSNEYQIKKERLRYIIEQKIDRDELCLKDENDDILRLTKSESPKRKNKSNTQKVDNKSNETTSKRFEVHINKKLIKKMVEWDTKNGILSTKQQQYLAYFAYDIKKLTEYHKKNARKYLKILKEAGFHKS